MKMLRYLLLSTVASLANFGQESKTDQVQFLVFYRGDHETQKLLDEFPTRPESELKNAGFTKYQLKSGELYVHERADRMLHVSATKDLLKFLSEQITDSSLSVDFSSLSEGELMRFALYANLGLGLVSKNGDGVLRSKAKLIAYPVIWIESNGKKFPLQCSSASELDRTFDYGSELKLPNFEEQSKKKSSPHGMRQWGLGFLGPPSRSRGQEQQFGKLIAEYGELLDEEIEKVEELQGSLSKRICEADPWMKQFGTISNGQTWNSLPDALKQQIRMFAGSYGLGNAEKANAFENGTIYRVSAGFGISTRSAADPNRMTGATYTFLLTPW